MAFSERAATIASGALWLLSRCQTFLALIKPLANGQPDSHNLCSIEWDVFPLLWSEPALQMFTLHLDCRHPARTQADIFLVRSCTAIKPLRETFGPRGAGLSANWPCVSANGCCAKLWRWRRNDRLECACWRTAARAVDKLARALHS